MSSGTSAGTGGTSVSGEAVGSGGAVDTAAAGGAMGTGGAAGTGGAKIAGDAGAVGGAKGMGGSTGIGGARTDGGLAKRCTGMAQTALASSAPALEPGVWKDISPPEMNGFKTNADKMIAQGLSMDPCNVGTLYWGTTPYDNSVGGVFKTTDGGGTWKKMGKLDEPLHVAIDPRDPKHLYANDGVRGATIGFWISNDGGETWTKPDSWKQTATNIGAFIDDTYDLAVDPTDFDHILVSFHASWGWTNTKWNANAGVLESKDGGTSWIVHEPLDGWGYGHAINFLYDPDLGIGDANTWLLGTQGETMWRTTDAGKTWSKVGNDGIMHGGGTTYYASNGTLYVSGYPHNQRSTDNGATWTNLGGPGSTTCVFGDGERLWSMPVYGTAPFSVATEKDGNDWKSYNNQSFKDGGPYEMVLDPVNRIVYASLWYQGVWALKLAD
jgi:hypothetical protein